MEELLRFVSVRAPGCAESTNNRIVSVDTNSNFQLQIAQAELKARSNIANEYIESRNFLVILGSNELGAALLDALLDAMRNVNASRTTIADLFRACLPVDSAGCASYLRRGRNFLKVMGGQFSSSTSDRLSDQSLVVSLIARKILIRAQAFWSSSTPPASACSSRLLLTASREQEVTELIENTIEQGRREVSEWLRAGRALD